MRQKGNVLGEGLNMVYLLTRRQTPEPWLQFRMCAHQVSRTIKK